MNLKYLSIVIVFLVLLVLAFKYTPEPTVENQVENTPEIPAPIVAENPDGEADPNRMKLDMTPWRWISAQYNDGTKIVPKTDKFVLTFKPDGTFSASTDCNGMGGNYKAGADKTITFSNMMSTLMFCEGSQEMEFRKILEGANSYFFTGRGELIIELKFDSGTATFR